MEKPTTMTTHDFEIRQVIQAVPGIVCETSTLLEIVAALSALLDENKEEEV